MFRKYFKSKRPFKETCRLFYYKLLRQSGSPEYLARGAALGVAVGFIIPISGQLIIGFPLAFWLKGSKIFMTAGTMISNPFTVVILYPIQILLGSWVIFRPLTFAELSAKDFSSFEAFRHLGAEIIIDFFIGGVVFSLLTVPIAYYLTLKLVRSYRRQKELRLKARRAAGLENAGLGSKFKKILRNKKSSSSDQQ